MATGVLIVEFQLHCSYCLDSGRRVVSHYLVQITLRLCCRVPTSSLRLLHSAASSFFTSSIKAINLFVWSSSHLAHNCNCSTSMMYDVDTIASEINCMPSNDFVEFYAILRDGVEIVSWRSRERSCRGEVWSIGNKSSSWSRVVNKFGLSV